MSALGRLLPLAVATLLAGCAAAVAVPPPAAVEPGWTAAAAAVRPVGLGLPGGAVLDDDVDFAGGVELVADSDSPLHSLSDLKLLGDGTFLSVIDNGLLARGRLRLDDEGDLVGVEGLAVRPLTRSDGQPVVERSERDAESLAVLADGTLLVGFERDHRLWSYGPARRAAERPTPLTAPDFAFANNDGMEGVAARADGGWRVAGESGGVWDCRPVACTVVVPFPETPLPDSDYRITGMDRDPAGDGYFVVQRSFSPPVDARARVRRMAADGSLGPVLVELKLPGTTDNFEGIAAVVRDGATRLYILSDDNNEPAQRTLLLAFDVRD